MKNASISPTIYKSLAEMALNFTGCSALHRQLNEFSELLFELSTSITHMQEMVNKHTRKENRSAMNYFINCVVDELSCQCVEFFSDDEPVKLRSFTSGKFTDVVNFTRSKDLFLSANRLSELLGIYDEKYPLICDELKKAANNVR